MNRKFNKKILIVILIMFISIGFAYLTSNLEIGGIGHLKKTVWDIHFDNVNILEGESLSDNPPIVTDHSTTSVTYSVNLAKPGDIYMFNIDVVNNGTVDAMISLITENTTLTEEQKKYAEYSITYNDGTPIQEKNFLGKHSKDTLLIIIRYKKDITTTELPTEAMSLDFTLNLTYMQAKKSDAKENTSTIIKDLSGNGNDGILYGGRINADGTIYLDGVDDYINCGLAGYDFKDSISYVARVKLLSYHKDASSEFFGNWQGAGGGLYIFKDNKIGANIYVNSDYSKFYSNQIANLNEFYTIVFTYDGAKMKLYVNGVEQQVNNSTETEISLTGNIVASPYPILLGGNPEGNFNKPTLYQPANIIISDAMIFDRALTPEEVSSDYGTTINPTNTSEMLFRYNMTGNVKDLSSAGNDGTILGNPIINNDRTVTFDGVNSCIRCGLSGYDFGNTISLVAKANILNKDNYESDILANFEFGGAGLYIKDGKARFAIHIDGGYKEYISNLDVEVNKWYTFVGTYNGAVMKLYVNGKEVPLNESNTTYEMDQTGNITQSYNDFMIAAGPNNNNCEWTANAIISEALIFDRALTKEEVRRDYGRIITPTDRSELLLHYKFK